MLKKITSVIACLEAGMLLFSLLEMVNAYLHPTPAGMDMKNPEAMKGLMDAMSIGAKLLLLVNYAVASLAGAVVSTAISKQMSQPVMIGLLLTAGNIFNLVEISHPLWLAVASMLVFFPFAYIGGMIILAREPVSPGS